MQKIRENLWKNLTEEQKENYDRLAEKFHQSFDVEQGHSRSHNVKEIALEECLAYLVESLKSGLHPKHTTVEERGLLESAYGASWYRAFGFEPNELEEEVDLNGDRVLRS